MPQQKALQRVTARARREILLLVGFHAFGNEPSRGAWPGLAIAASSLSCSRSGTNPSNFSPLVGKRVHRCITQRQKPNKAAAPSRRMAWR